MHRDDPFGDCEQAIAAFVTSVLGLHVASVERLASFVTNAVYKVDSDGLPLIVKASTLHGALRAEAWACARGADVGCAAPAIRGLGRLGPDGRMSALIMEYIEGCPATPGHPAYAEVGVRLRRLHETRIPGFGWLAETAYSDGGEFVHSHGSWLGFLHSVVDDVRRMADSYAIAKSVAEAAASAVDAHSDAITAVAIGSLCHGDLKAAHVLIDSGRLAGVIDWGDAVIADPIWDIARFAHRADEASLSLLVEGYDPERELADDLAWRVPLYGALWMIVDATVDHRLGHRADATLEAALGMLVEQTG